MIRTQLELKGATHETAEAFVEENLKVENLKNDLNNLDYDALIGKATEARESEIEKANSWEGIGEFAEQIVDGTIQSKYGNVDMDKRTVIHYSDEILNTWKEQMSSWGTAFDEETQQFTSNYFKDISEAVAKGEDVIDTVWGGEAKFQMQKGEVSVAFTPIMVDENGNNPEFLSEGTVYNYIQTVLDKADKAIRESGEAYSKEAVIKKAFEIDLQGMNTEEIDSQGRVIGTKFVHGIMAAIDNSAYGIQAEVVSALMHFSGDEGAFQLADDAIEAYNSLKEKAAEGTLDITNLTGEEIRVLENEGIVAKETGQYLAQLALQKQIANAGEIDTSEEVQALAELAKEAGIDIAELQYLSELQAAISARDANAAAGLHTEYWDARIDELKANMVSEIQSSLNDLTFSLSYDPSSVKDTSSKAGKDSADEYVKAYEREKKSLERDRDMGLITEREYLDKLKALIDKFFKDRAKYAQNYLDEMKEYMDALLSHYNSVISGVVTIFDHKINKLQKERDKIVESLTKEKEAIEETLQTEIDGIEEQIYQLDKLIEKKNEQIEKLQEQIDKINEANEARQRSITLQKAEYELQRAQNQRNKLVYTGETGQMRYEADQGAVRDAQEQLKQAQDEMMIASIEKQIKVIEKQVKALEKQKKYLSDQQETLQRQLDKTTKHYEKLIKEQEKYYDEQIKALENIKSKWEELAEIEEVSKAWGLVSEEMESLGFTMQDVLDGNDAAFEAFKNKYVEVLAQMHSQDSGFLDGLKEEAGQLPAVYDQFAKIAEEAKNQIKDVDDTASSASGGVSKLGGSAGTAAKDMEDLSETSKDAKDSVSKLDQEKLDKISEEVVKVNEKIKELEEAVGGPGKGLYGALSSLNEIKFDTLKSTLDTLKQDVKDAANEINNTEFNVGGGTGPDKGVIDKGGTELAEAKLPSGYTSIELGDSFDNLLASVKVTDVPTMKGIKSAVAELTKAVTSEVKNITTTNTDVVQNNTFNITGVTGEEVTQKINTTLMQTFSGMSLNAYQRSMV